MKISQLLGAGRGLTALIGGGGKTTLMYRLAEELSANGTVILCASTKIIEPTDVAVVTDGSPEIIAASLRARRVICAGTRVADGKLTAPKISFDELKTLADYVIVEADGAHMLPIKAHAPYEPVIPACADLTVLVIGADAFGQPISRICHRPELFAQISGADLDSPVTPELAARVIDREGYGDVLYINKVETPAAMKNSELLAELVGMPVTAGSLFTEEYLCLR